MKQNFKKIVKEIFRNGNSMYVSADGHKNETTDGQFIKADGQLIASKLGIYHFRLLVVPYNYTKCPKKIV